MAEVLGLTASLFEIAKVGFKLATTIYDFTANIVGAGSQMLDIAGDITNLCEVFDKLHYLMQNPRVHPSETAEQELRKIISRCTEIFNKIRAIVTKLKTDRGEGNYPPPEFMDTVKWAFSGKKKVEALRAELETCKSTLSVMLNVMQLGEIAALSSDVAEQRIMFSQCLLIMQQHAVEKLEFYEEKAEGDEDGPTQAPAAPTARRTSTWNQRRNQVRIMGVFNRPRVTNPPSPIVIPESQPTHAERASPPTRAERASVWLNAIVAPLDKTQDIHPGVQIKKRLSSVGTEDAPMQLLRKWTVQGDNLDRLSGPIRQQKLPPDTQADALRDSKYSFSSSNTLPGADSLDEIQPDSSVPRQGILKRPTDLISPRGERLQSVGFHIFAGVNGTLEASSDITALTGPDESCDTIIRSILKDHGCSHKLDKVELCIAYSGRIKILEASDKPLEVLRQFEDWQLDPRFFIRTRS